jgi:hypothetical protein
MRYWPLYDSTPRMTPPGSYTPIGSTTTPGGPSTAIPTRCVNEPNLLDCKSELIGLELPPPRRGANYLLVNPICSNDAKPSGRLISTARWAEPGR